MRAKTQKKSGHVTKKTHSVIKKTLTVSKDGCAICKTDCIEDAPKITCHIRPNTRSYAKMLKDFIIIEVYRSMPLLGNETDNAPNWEAHIVRYSVVFIKDTEFLKKCLAMLKS